MVQYDDFWETFGKSRRDMHWEEITLLLERFVVQAGDRDTWSIADIGCGNGRLLHHILESDLRSEFLAHHLTYTGLDSSRVLLSQAQVDERLQWYFSPLWLLGDMRESERLLASRQPFDVCFLIASFHHLESYAERLHVLLQLKKLLRPTWVISMTNWHLLHENQKKYRTSQTNTYTDGSADFHIKIGTHVRLYHAFSPWEYDRLGQDAGLGVSYEFWERNSLVTWSLK
jgi:SAM-dependent methyltransferase